MPSRAPLARLAATEHIMHGISACTPNCINVSIEGTEALAKFAQYYDLVIVCRAETVGKPFWRDPDLFRSERYPLADGVIQVRAPPEFLRRVCMDRDLFQCIPTLASRKTDKLTAINPGLRTDADCRQRSKQ